MINHRGEVLTVNAPVKLVETAAVLDAPFYQPLGNEQVLFEQAWQHGMPVLIKGPTGCGKTRFVQHMAHRLNLPLFTVACHDDLSAADLVGRHLIGAQGTWWQDGPLTRAVREGGICYLDEVVEARKDTTVVLHPLTDDRRILPIERTGEELQAPPGFMLVVSYNPGYQNLLKGLKPSTRQRFVAIDLGYPPADTERHIVMNEGCIDAAQAAMLERGIQAKALIEGPPRRAVPILLRQTSFKALEEEVAFPDATGTLVPGSHSARFGEIEQRGAALTPKGRALYDRLLNAARDELGDFPNEANAARYDALMTQHFAEFPDSIEGMREQGLAYFRYFATEKGLAAEGLGESSLEDLLRDGYVKAEPLVYEDFLPVSAAGIFQSNLGDAAQTHYSEHSNRQAFEQALGRATIDELGLYADTQRRSIEECAQVLGLKPL